MNSTNRVLNRTLLVIVGLILFGLGSAAILVSSSGPARDGFTSGATNASDTVTSWLKATPLQSGGHSWLWIVAAAIAAVLIVILAVIVSRQGRGHTRALLTDTATADGQTVVAAAVAEELLADALDGRPELVSSRVSTYAVKGMSVLKVSVLCRRGVSPHQVSRMVESQLFALDDVLGFRVPALVQVSGGFRVRSSRATRLQ